VIRFRLVAWPIYVVGCLTACLGASAATTTPAPAPAPAAVTLPLPSDQVVSHVSRTISWYRGIVNLQQLPVDSEDVVPRDRLYQTALTSLELAFDFGHAAGILADKAQAGANARNTGAGTLNAGAGTPTPNAASASNVPGARTPVAAGAPNADADDSQDSGSQANSVDQAAARMADRISNLQSQLTALDEQIAHAAAKDKDTLVARRAEVSAALDLAKEIQGTVAQIQRFEAMSDTHGGGASGGLAARIADLRRSVPELGALSTGSKPASPTTPVAPATGPANSASAANAATFRPESAGVIALFGKWFSLEGARRQLEDEMKQTDGLAKDLEKIRSDVTREARSLARQNLDATFTDPAQLAQAKQRLQEAATRFKQLSTLLVPIGEQDITLDDARNLLEEWRDSMAARTATVARYLALRLGFLLGSIAVVLVISEVWRRATFRYLHDARRRQQFLALRRVAVGLALTIVVVFGLVSEVGSLATYAGLITAGLAVALQNVILAVVAYFFLIGRYGVRVGDRITLAGVTGRVVEIGLIRIYLLELTGPQLRSTGRMVVLSNAVLFQPTALFKQMPGGDFYWHMITLTLSPTTDVAEAEKRLSEAAESVYAKYRPAIEQQHAALQRFIDFQTAMPQPEVYARLNTKGLVVTVRYPVEPARAAATDQKMLLALGEARSKAPELPLVEGPLLDTAES
jgi:small-conductance mechanosensitive channel